MSDETLRDVMWEIAEARERADLIDGRELKRRVVKAWTKLPPSPYSISEGQGRRRAFAEVLSMLDEMGV